MKSKSLWDSMLSPRPTVSQYIEDLVIKIPQSMARSLFKVNIEHHRYIISLFRLERDSDFLWAFQGQYSLQSINNAAACFQIHHPALNPPH